MKKKNVRNNRIRRTRRKRGFLYEIDTVPVYRRFDKYTQRKTRVAYFNDYCVAQVGMSWDDIMESLLEFRHGYPQIEEYWLSLRKDFFAWTEANDLSGWGVHMYPDK